MPRVFVRSLNVEPLDFFVFLRITPIWLEVIDANTSTLIDLKRGFKIIAAITALEVVVPVCFETSFPFS
jgi:hypothetical protein